MDPTSDANDRGEAAMRDERELRHMVNADRDDALMKVERLTAERDAAVRELNAIRGEHTPGEMYSLANPRPSLAGVIQQRLVTVEAERDALKAELQTVKSSRDGWHERACLDAREGAQLRADNERLRSDATQWEVLARERQAEVVRLRAELARADKALGSLGIKLSDAEARLAADHCPTCMDNANRLGDALTQLRELREAASALVEHIERKYYHLVAPSPKAIEQHGELGRLAGTVHDVLAKVTPPADTTCTGHGLASDCPACKHKVTPQTFIGVDPGHDGGTVAIEGVWDGKTLTITKVTP